MDASARSEQEARDADRTEAQCRAQRMEAFGQLAAGVAHDFNNFLTAIRYHTAFARNAVDPDQPVQAELAAIDRAATRAGELTEQLLAFGRRKHAGAEVVDPNDVITEILPTLRRLVGTRIELCEALSREVRYVRIDRGQLQQILVNLVVNARDAIEATGTVRVSTGLDLGKTPHVVIEVRDDGRGMSPETRTRIFEPYFTTKAPGHGTGLGLPVVYGIVTASGGTIEVDSEPGLGSAFRIRLPCVDAPVKLANTTATPAAGIGLGEWILLVEDDTDLRESAARSLREAGYRVIVARNTSHAIDQLKDRRVPIDLLLTDVAMPDMLGTEIVEHARAHRPDLPVLVVTGDAARANAVEELLIRRLEVLRKPFTPRRMLVRVRALLDRVRVMK
ncbi:MAG: hypothetical protein OHK0013_29430 [Sandaracinaceae bacterium]